MGSPDLVASMAFDPLSGLAELEEHLAALKADAAERGYPFDRHAVRNELQAATFRLRDARLVRLLIAPSGTVAIEVSVPVAVAKGSPTPL
jgi:para-aminobenzoate synthetase/4-amino-4-deoxychorismate lyase